VYESIARMYFSRVQLKRLTTTTRYNAFDLDLECGLG
jgi:hypothetical protein